MPVTVPSLEGREPFESELLAHLDVLLHVAIKFTGARDDAEDLVSDTVLRALARWEQYRPGSNLRAWLVTMLYRLFVTRWRRVRGREVRLVGEGRPSAPIGQDPEQHFYDSLVDEEVARVLESLPAHYRLPVVLRDMDDLSYAQIAALLGVATGTVKSRVFRARRLLRVQLHAYAAEMGYVRGPAAA